MNLGTVVMIIVLGVMMVLMISAYILLIIQDFTIRKRLKSLAEEEDRVTEDGREDKPGGVHTKGK